MIFLFIHQNFPGQFRHVALEALRRHDQVVAIGRDSAPGIAGVKLYRYQPSTKLKSSIDPFLLKYEETVSAARQVYELISGLKRAGFRPDVIIAHPGWGETLFVKDVYSDVPLVHFCEYYYRAQGADSGFDPEFSCASEGPWGIRILNSMHLLSLEQCDVAISPTQWQRGLFPPTYQSKIRVIHEGVIQESGSPVDSLELTNGVVLKAGDQIVTYVARNLEPYRGFHSFMRSIPYIQAQCPNAQIIVVGGNEVSYGRMPAGFANWRSRMMSEVKFDMSRVHFLGKIPYQKYRAVLQLSMVHVYLTYPFVLSWSLLEALASGCVVVGSDTAPVKEIMVDGVDGLLVDFFDHQAIAEKVCRVLKDPGQFEPVRRAAKLTASKFDVKSGVNGYFSIFDEIVNKSADLSF